MNIALPTLLAATSLVFASLAIEATAASADLSITNSDGMSSAAPGGTVTYTIVAANGGPDDAPGAGVSVTFPAVTVCNWTCGGSNNGVCTASGSGNIADTVDLPDGASVTYSATCSIHPQAVGTLVTTATVTAPSGVGDPAPSNNTATDSDPLMAQADLAIDNTDGVTEATPGGSVTYTITASNLGPSEASNAQVKDTFPATLVCSWTCAGTGGGTCTASGSGSINKLVDLPPGGAVVYTASCLIASSASGGIVNTATITAPGGTPDPVNTNNSKTDTDTLIAQADLSINVDDGVATATPGGTVSYTVTAANAGPSNAAGSTVTDAFPASLSCSWTCSHSGGASCTASGSGNINQIVSLPKNGSVTYTASCNVDPAAVGSLDNTAGVATSATVTEIAPDDNSATDSDTLAPQADLAITNSDAATTAIAGGTVSYVIQASNLGPSNAPGATVMDSFPASLACTWTCAGSSGATCSASGTGAIGDTAGLPSGGSATYTALCSIASNATGTLTNTASVAAPAGVADPVSANDARSDTDNLAVQADVTVAIDDGVAAAMIGDVLDYTITIGNNGPSDAVVSVADALPPELSGGGWTCIPTAGATCNDGSGNVLSDSATVPAGSSATYVFSTLLIGTNPGDSIANTATAGLTNGSDPTAANDSSTDTDAVAIFHDGFESPTP